jgi:hypothetical protein
MDHRRLPLWKRNPALITFLVFGYWLCLLVVAAVPFVGQVLMSLIMPALSLGIYNGCKAVAEGARPGPTSCSPASARTSPSWSRSAAST